MLLFIHTLYLCYTNSSCFPPYKYTILDGFRTIKNPQIHKCTQMLGQTSEMLGQTSDRLLKECSIPLQWVEGEEGGGGRRSYEFATTRRKKKSTTPYHTCVSVCVRRHTCVRVCVRRQTSRVSLCVYDAIPNLCQCVRACVRAHARERGGRKGETV